MSASPTRLTGTYYERNKDKIAERLRQKRLADTDSYRQRCRDYYHKNKARVLQYKKKHRDANRDIYNDRAKQRRRNNPNEGREYHLRKKFGLTPKQYETMLKEQGGVCAICHKTEEEGKNFSVDHCHDTGLVRALLCAKCNVALGGFNDDPELLEQAAAYLRHHK